MTAGDAGSYDRLQLNAADRFGRPIDPVVLSAAEQLGKRVICYSEKLVGDPAVVADLLEQCSAVVSRVLRRNHEKASAIRDLQAYLFRAFIRRVNRSSRRQPQIRAWDFGLAADYRESLEHKLILDEFLRSCDPITRQMLYRRIEGFSWKEIAKLYEISTHAAEARCSQAVQRVRRKLGYRD